MSFVSLANSATPLSFSTGIIVASMIVIPVEGELVVLYVPGLQHAAGLGVVVGVNNHGLR